LGVPDGLFGELYHVGRGGQSVEVTAIGLESGGDYAVGVGGIGVEDVVSPVGVEDGTMVVAVLTIGGFPISGLEHREEVRQEVYQHARRYEAACGDARDLAVVLLFLGHLIQEFP